MKHESWRLGALYKNLARFRMSRSKVKVTGSKKEKVRHFVLESSSGVRSYSAAFLSGAVLGARLRRWENQRMLSSITLSSKMLCTYIVTANLFPWHTLLSYNFIRQYLLSDVICDKCYRRTFWIKTLLIFSRIKFCDNLWHASEVVVTSVNLHASSVVTWFMYWKGRFTVCHTVSDLEDTFSYLSVSMKLSLLSVKYYTTLKLHECMHIT